MKDILFIFDHLGGREPGNCIAFGVSVFKGFLKLCYEIFKGSGGKGGGGRGEGKLLEGGCPCGCRFFVHIQEGKSDLLFISVIDRFVDYEIVLHEHCGWLRYMRKESFKVGHRLIEVIKSLASSGATKWTRGKGRLGLGASNLRQGRYDVCIAQIKSGE